MSNPNSINLKEEIPQDKPLRDQQLAELADRTILKAMQDNELNLKLDEILAAVASNSGYDFERISAMQSVVQHFAELTTVVADYQSSTVGVYLREDQPEERHCSAEGTHYRVEINYDARTTIADELRLISVTIMREVSSDTGHFIALFLQEGEAWMTVYDDKTMHDVLLISRSRQKVNPERNWRERARHSEARKAHLSGPKKIADQAIE